jgi:hypothetical protein
MIEALAATFVLLSKAGRLLSTNPSAATMWRWALRGVDGVKLESFKIGGRRYTTAEALDRFVARLNGPRAANTLQVASRPEQQKDLAARRAEEIYGSWEAMRRRESPHGLRSLEGGNNEPKTKDGR